jgi:hypothetical protein
MGLLKIMETQENQGITEGASKREGNPNFTPEGRFASGNNANPHGRPKFKRITEAYAAILEEHGAEALAERVYCDALTAKNPHDRLAAIQEITDRVEGKAVQTTRIEQALDGQTARVLAELANRLIVPDRPALGTIDPSNTDQ